MLDRACRHPGRWVSKAPERGDPISLGAASGEDHVGRDRRSGPPRPSTAPRPGRRAPLGRRRAAPRGCRSARAGTAASPRARARRSVSSRRGRGSACRQGIDGDGRRSEPDREGPGSEIHPAVTPDLVNLRIQVGPLRRQTNLERLDWNRREVPWLKRWLDASRGASHGIERGHSTHDVAIGSRPAPGVQPSPTGSTPSTSPIGICRKREPIKRNASGSPVALNR